MIRRLIGSMFLVLAGLAGLAMFMIASTAMARSLTPSFNTAQGLGNTYSCSLESNSYAAGNALFTVTFSRLSPGSVQGIEVFRGGNNCGYRQFYTMYGIPEIGRGLMSITHLTDGSSKCPVMLPVILNYSIKHSGSVEHLGLSVSGSSSGGILWHGDCEMQ